MISIITIIFINNSHMRLGHQLSWELLSSIFTSTFTTTISRVFLLALKKWTMSLCFPLHLQCLSLYLFLISILSQWIMEISSLECCLTHLRATIATRKVTAGCKNTVVLEFIHCNHGLPCPSTTRLEVLCVGRKVPRSTVQR